MEINYRSDTLQEAHGENSQFQNFMIQAAYPVASAELTYTDLNLMVTDSDNGWPVCRAMISIDAIGMTAICSNSGNVKIRDILPGFYLLDIIAPGYIARSLGIIIPANYLQELHVKMVSNS